MYHVLWCSALTSLEAIILKTGASLYFTILGVMAFISTFLPHFIIYGYFLFFLPGIILQISLSLFIYSSLIFMGGRILQKLEQEKPFIKSAGFVICLGVVSAFALNAPAYKAALGLAQKDSDSYKDIKSPEVIALSYIDGRYTGYSGQLCAIECQKLLRGDVVKEVIVIKGEGNPRAFSLNDRPNCKASRPVNLRRFGSECLQSKEVPRDIKPPVLIKLNTLNKTQLSERGVNVNRVLAVQGSYEVLLKVGEKYEPVAQRIRVKLDLFLPLLSMGTNFGNQLSVSWGIYKYDKSVIGKYNYKTFDKDSLGYQLERVFR